MSLEPIPLTMKPFEPGKPTTCATIVEECLTARDIEPLINEIALEQIHIELKGTVIYDFFRKRVFMLGAALAYMGAFARALGGSNKFFAYYSNIITVSGLVLMMISSTVRDIYIRIMVRKRVAEIEERPLSDAMIISLIDRLPSTAIVKLTPHQFSVVMGERVKRALTQFKPDELNEVQNAILQELIARFPAIIGQATEPIQGADDPRGIDIDDAAGANTYKYLEAASST